METVEKPAEHARKAVDVASEKQASDIHLLDTTRVCDFADFFVIMSAESRRQMETVAHDVEKALTGSPIFKAVGGFASVCEITVKGSEGVSKSVKGIKDRAKGLLKKLKE